MGIRDIIHNFIFVDKDLRARPTRVEHIVDLEVENLKRRIRDCSLDGEYCGDVQAYVRSAGNLPRDENGWQWDRWGVELTMRYEITQAVALEVMDKVAEAVEREFSAELGRAP